MTSLGGAAGRLRRFAGSSRVRTNALRILAALVALAVIDAYALSRSALDAWSIVTVVSGLPAAIAVGFGRNWRRYAFTLIAVAIVVVAFLLSLDNPNVAGGVDAGVLSIIVLGAIIMLAPLVPNAVRLRDDLKRFAASLRAWSARMRASSTARGDAVIRLTSSPVNRTASIAAVAVGTALVVAVALKHHESIARDNAAAAVFAVLDLLIGSAAIGFVSFRLVGAGAAAAVALFWACSGIRMSFAAFPDAFMPTAVLPLAVAAVLFLRGTRRPYVLVGVLAVVAAATIVWPLLGVSTAIVLAISVRLVESDAAVVRTSTLAVVLVVLEAAAVVVFAGAPLTREGGILAGREMTVACASGCDGGLPWEFFFPSAFGALYRYRVTAWQSATFHFGNIQADTVAAGWPVLVAAIGGTVVLLRKGAYARLTLILLGIGVGLVLALPSHYAGTALPSVAAFVTALHPAFMFGSQTAIVSAFFAALLGGYLIAGLARYGGVVGVAATVVACVAMLVDIDEPPAPTVVRDGVAAVISAVPNGASGGTLTAVYPFLTPSDGVVYRDMAEAARARGLDLFNGRVDDPEPMSDITDPQTLPRLRARGVKYVVIVLPAYAQRSRIIGATHLLMPDGEGLDDARWHNAQAASVGEQTILATRPDGTVLIAL